jgi:allophanate hydrolase subunit 2
MVLGSIEVPPSGQPIVFLADHPATGGYPILGVVEPDDVAVLAQTRPGSTVCFNVKRATAPLAGGEAHSR